ncbi:hypothetical protein [Loktanella sp. Alg231-35]|uniref:hypothetical protein n=1 Tax=Loktanella sp. Alg231-35 TaxID=1922220 RepID=UPI000D551BCC|nr:hypothetical protein [Loktanella sp. Alg231-35]
MNIWIVITDDCNGIRARPFTTGDQADAAALAWCAEDWQGPAPCPDNWREAYRALGDVDDAIWIEKHAVDVTNALADLTKSAKAQLADLLHQVYQMQGIFNDEDGSIQRAVEAAEAWLALPATYETNDA